MRSQLVHCYYFVQYSLYSVGMNLGMEVSGLKLKELREERSLSQRELADRSGVAHTTIHALEVGKRTAPWPRTTRRLAKALGVEPRELSKGER